MKEQQVVHLLIPGASYTTRRCHRVCNAARGTASQSKNQREGYEVINKVIRTLNQRKSKEQIHNPWEEGNLPDGKVVKYQSLPPR